MPDDYRERVIGVELPSSALSRGGGVTNGAHRRDALLSALTGGLVKALVLDQPAAVGPLEAVGGPASHVPRADCDADEGSPARGPRRVELVEVPAPSRLAEDDILLRIQAVGICGTDLHYTGGQGNADFPLPFIMGHESPAWWSRPAPGSTAAPVDSTTPANSCPMMNGSGKSAFPVVSPR